MTQPNAYPDYGAADGAALRALYNVSFSLDLTQMIPLAGSWQGSPVYARALRVNNFNNSSSLTYSIGSSSGVIPAYSDGYIDIRGALYIEITSLNANYTLPIEVWNVEKSYGFVQRGNIPGAATDSFSAKTIGLFHFEGANGGKVCLNESSIANTNAVTMAAGSASTTTTADFFFGSSCFNSPVPGPSTTNNCSLPFTSTGLGVTFDLCFKVVSLDALHAAGSVMFCAAGADGRGLWIDSLAYGAPNTFFNLVYKTTAAAGTLNFNTVFNVGQWYQLAIVEINGVGIAYVNGVICSTVGNIGFATPVTPTNLAINNGGANCYHRIDELRITNAARYAQNYIPAIAPFAI